MRYLILIAFMFGLCKAQIPAGILSQKTGNDIYFITFSTDSIELQYPAPAIWPGKEITFVYRGAGYPIDEVIAPEYTAIGSGGESDIGYPTTPSYVELGSTGVFLEMSTNSYHNISILQGGLTPNRLNRVFSSWPRGLSIISDSPNNIRIHLYTNIDDNLYAFADESGAYDQLISAIQYDPFGFIGGSGYIEIPNNQLHNNPFTLNPNNPSGGWASSPIIPLLEDSGDYVWYIVIPDSYEGKLNQITTIGIEIIP